MPFCKKFIDIILCINVPGRINYTCTFFKAHCCNPIILCYHNIVVLSCICNIHINTLKSTIYNFNCGIIALYKVVYIAKNKYINLVFFCFLFNKGDAWTSISIYNYFHIIIFFLVQPSYPGNHLYQVKQTYSSYMLQLLVG